MNYEKKQGATRNIAYLSLGSNLGERKAQLLQTIGRLRQVGFLTNLSSVYETEPVEFADQPLFLNCAAGLEVGLTPEDLMDSLLRIEAEMGRQRTDEQKKGPRTIDLDILFFGNVVMTSQKVVIPHPAMHLRRFVLEPMAEIAPDFLHPIFQKTIEQLRDALPAGQTVNRMKWQ